MVQSWSIAGPGLWRRGGAVHGRSPKIGRSHHWSTDPDGMGDLLMPPYTTDLDHLKDILDVSSLRCWFIKPNWRLHFGCFWVILVHWDSTANQAAFVGTMQRSISSSYPKRDQHGYTTWDDAGFCSRSLLVIVASPCQEPTMGNLTCREHNSTNTL